MVVQNERLCVCQSISCHYVRLYISGRNAIAAFFRDPCSTKQTIPHNGAWWAGSRGWGSSELRIARYNETRKDYRFGNNAHVIAWNDHPAVQASLRNITERKMLEREQTLWIWEQETLSDIDRKLVGVVELDKIFAAILQQTLNLTRAHFGGILLFDELQLHVQWTSILRQHTSTYCRTCSAQWNTGRYFKNWRTTYHPKCRYTDAISLFPALSCWRGKTYFICVASHWL